MVSVWNRLPGHVVKAVLLLGLYIQAGQGTGFYLVLGKLFIYIFGCKCILFIGFNDFNGLIFMNF